MHSALHALLLAALVATAGCSGVFDGDPEPATRPSGTDHGGPVPGLTDDGLGDPNALVDAHAGSLDGESLTLQERRVQRYENGSLRWRENVTLRTAANRTRYLVVTDATGKPMLGGDEGRAEVFADGDRVYRSVRTPNGSWADVLRTGSGDPEPPGAVSLDPARTDDLYVVLSVFAVNASENVREVTPDGRRYLVETANLDHPDLLASHLELDAVRNATLDAVVTPDGRVEEYRVAFEGTHDGAVVRGAQTVWYEEVVETTVEAPDWLDEVEDRNGTSEEMTSEEMASEG